MGRRRVARKRPQPRSWTCRERGSCVAPPRNCRRVSPERVQHARLAYLAETGPAQRRDLAASFGRGPASACRPIAPRNPILNPASAPPAMPRPRRGHKKRTNAGRPLRRSSRQQVWRLCFAGAQCRTAPGRGKQGPWRGVNGGVSGRRSPSPDRSACRLGNAIEDVLGAGPKHRCGPVQYRPELRSRTSPEGRRDLRRSSFRGRAATPAAIPAGGPAPASPVPARAIWPPALGSPDAKRRRLLRAGYATCSPIPICLCADC